MKASGSGQALLPHGITSVMDIPWDLARAIEHAHRILGWQENLSSDEQPPQWMWAHEDELKEWFDEVRIAREEKWGTGGDDDNDSDMMGNELADAKKRG